MSAIVNLSRLASNVPLVGSLKSDVAKAHFSGLGNQYKKGSAYGNVSGMVGKSKDMDHATTLLNARQEKIGEKLPKAKGGSYNALKTESSEIENALAGLGKGDFAKAKASEKARLTGLMKAEDDVLGSQLKATGGVAKDYFLGGNMKQNATRIGAVAGAYGAAAVGSRYMSGGGVTYNNQGKRDIAGIPFL